MLVGDIRQLRKWLNSPKDTNERGELFWLVVLIDSW
jgi:hypothetical protein